MSKHMSNRKFKTRSHMSKHMSMRKSKHMSEHKVETRVQLETVFPHVIDGAAVAGKTPVALACCRGLLQGFVAGLVAGACCRGLLHTSIACAGAGTAYACAGDVVGDELTAMHFSASYEHARAHLRCICGTGQMAGCFLGLSRHLWRCARQANLQRRTRCCLCSAMVAPNHCRTNHYGGAAMAQLLSRSRYGAAAMAQLLRLRRYGYGPKATSLAAATAQGP